LFNNPTKVGIFHVFESCFRFNGLMLSLGSVAVLGTKSLLPQAIAQTQRSNVALIVIKLNFRSTTPEQTQQMQEIQNQYQIRLPNGKQCVKPGKSCLS